MRETYIRWRPRIESVIEKVSLGKEREREMEKESDLESELGERD